MTPKYDKSKTYKYATGQYFTCYYYANGASYEVGIYAGDKTIFFGNFINKSEATAWYKEMTTKMSHFVTEYPYYPKMKTTWYYNFAKNYFYNTYYAYLYKAFTKYNSGYKKAYTADMKTYKKYESTYAYNA